MRTKKFKILFILSVAICFGQSSFAQQKTAQAISETAQQEVTPDNIHSNVPEKTDVPDKIEGGKQLPSTPIPTADTSAFSITSSTFNADSALPAKTAFNKFDCGGKNISPQLLWKNAPEGTKSFVVTEYDPDAPTVSGFWHWGIYNIPASINELKEGVNAGGLPKGSSEIFTDYGSNGYGGSCPPVGDKAHRYIFTVYALDVAKLDLKPATTTGAFLMFNIGSHIIDKARVTGTYERKQK